MEKKINNWADYEKLFKEERYNVSKIEDTYVYKLQEEINSLRAEVIEANENATWWKNRFNAVNAQMYGHGGAHQHFFVDSEEVKDILEEMKDQSVLLPRIKHFDVTLTEDDLKAGTICSPGAVFDPLTGQPAYRFSDSVTVENDVLKTTFSRDGIIDAIIKEEGR